MNGSSYSVAGRLGAQVVPGEDAFAVFGFTIAVLAGLFFVTMMTLAVCDSVTYAREQYRARKAEQAKRAEDEARWQTVVAFPGEPAHLDLVGESAAELATLPPGSTVTRLWPRT